MCSCGPLHDGIPDAQSEPFMNQETQEWTLKIAPRPLDDHTAFRRATPTDAANITKNSQNDSTGTPQTLRFLMTRRPALLARDLEY